MAKAVRAENIGYTEINNMTELNHILTFPVRRSIIPYDGRVNAMENLISLDNRLKRDGHEDGIYNRKCMITTGDRDSPIAICRVTTRGDTDWLQEEIDKEPFVKKKILIDEFDVTEDELRRVEKYRRLTFHY
jgi:hypothetical protein